MSAITVKDVHKKFKVYFDKGQSLKDRILFRNRNYYEDRWVLKGVSFQVEKGEAVGIIGENGCGKSTLLKLMTKIMYPDQGSIELTGRVSSLIELGAGFHPDMSGRENIFTNGSIFGFSKKEIAARINGIIVFCELQEFIDNPVRTYSSGMYMRLAFSVAISVDADILLVDEILAVGDASFQAKCFNKMKEIKAKGTTIAIVSHSMSQIEQICDKVIWIEEGVIRQSGRPREVIQEYMSWIMSKDQPKPIESSQKKCGSKENEEKVACIEDKQEKEPDISQLRKDGEWHELGNQDVVITNIALYDGKTNQEKNNFNVTDFLKLKVFYKLKNPKLKDAIFSIIFYRNDGINCFSTNTYIDTQETINLNATGSVTLIIEPIQLMQGAYSADISFIKDYGPIYHEILNAFKFTIYNTQTDVGVYRPNHRWEIQ